ncbi:MAG: DsrE family protein [Gammaproteobacteria bacterium]|nr:DsrE family protein [Gammaproteobacteria bacterium]
MNLYLVKKIFILITFFLYLIGTSSLATAADHKMVIQINSKDKVTHKMGLINAGNLKSQLGINNVDVEVVIYGPGLSMVKADSVFKNRIQKLQSRGVEFSVCGGTLKAIAKKTGKEPELLEGMKRVRTGALRILELQEAGYAYLRP